MGDDGLVEVYSKMHPMTEEEKEDMEFINYSSNPNFIAVIDLVKTSQLSNIDGIEEQVIADFCFGETYMLKD